MERHAPVFMAGTETAGPYRRKPIPSRNRNPSMAFLFFFLTAKFHGLEFVEFFQEFSCILNKYL